jgi:hypothetical protein
VVFTEVDFTEESTTAVTIFTGKALALDISDLTDQAAITVGVTMAAGITGVEVMVSVMVVEGTVVEVAGGTVEVITRSERESSVEFTSGGERERGWRRRGASCNR